MPGIGERMILGHVRSNGLNIQRRRIRDSIRRVDPGGLMDRTERLTRTIRRRIYSVPHPHYMWHIDGNHKLIRWGFVIHAAIDGFSRCCLYLNASTNNSSDTVLDQFHKAISLYNTIPTRIRSDYGTENVKVWEAMESSTSERNGPAVLLGSSVHNQRVERFNREINKNIRDKFAVLFYNLENSDLLNVTCKNDLFALHYVFLQRINQALTVLANSHNHHSIRTENNQTPNQILASHGYITPTHHRDDGNIQQLLYDAAEPPFVLSDEDLEYLTEQVPPLTSDDTEGQTVYEAVREYVHLHSQL